MSAPQMNAVRAPRFHERSKDCPRRALARTPETVDARGDHRAARAEFLDEMGGALAQRIRSGIVARIHIVRIVAWIDENPGRRAAVATALRRQFRHRRWRFCQLRG